MFFIAAGLSPSIASGDPSAPDALIPTQIVVGTVVSVDAAKNEVVVTNTLGGWTKTFTVPAIAIPSLRADRTIQLTILEGTTTAVKVANYRHRSNQQHRQGKAARQNKALAAAEASKAALRQMREQ